MDLDLTNLLKSRPKKKTVTPELLITIAGIVIGGTVVTAVFTMILWSTFAGLLEK